MRRLAALLLLPLLSACTGTFEIRPPIVLIASFDDGTPQLALIRDNFATEATAAPRELVFLEASRRTLPAPAVAFDVVDRAGERPTLAVLSREATAPFTGFLRGFSLQGVDPEVPAAFAEDAGYARDLTALLRSQPELPDDADYCLVDLQISASGRYLALLEDRSTCGSEAFVALYLLDLDENKVVKVVDTKPLVPAGLYLDQRADRLYYLSEGVANASLERLAVASGDGGAIADLDGRNQIDLAPVAPTSGSGADEALVALSASSFQPVFTASPAEAGPRLDTQAGAHTIIDDPFERSELLLVLGSSRFTVHRSIEDDGGRSVSVTAAAGTFQPEELFVYLASEGRVFIFDALVDDGSGTPALAPFNLPELISPGPITWLRGVDSAP